ncbi:MAG: HD domain-containing protein, partial [Actinobacteria bacterium]|nr:HD domain-containing protein [Actinomycetota bacterium]
KDRLVARTGSPYLALELRDRTGSVQARLFRDADLHGARFERGDLIRVTGRVSLFRGELQAELTAARKAQEGEADPAAFLPVAYRDLDELDGFLESLAGEVRQPGLRALLEHVLRDDELRAALRRSPATRSAHHAYLGGLLEHTVGVAQLALETCAIHPRLDQDLLLTAAIVHDVGRTRELQLGAEIGLTEEGRMLGHIELGLRMLAGWCARTGLDDARALAVSHCVLTHHGAEAAGRGGRGGFALPEALALQRLNALDAAVKGAIEHGMGLDASPPAA